MVNKVRTRFAPSPSGFLHLGGARTALFNYLFAKHYNGKFIVRIEDTDRKRHQEQTIISLIEDLKWLGIQIDETIGTISQFQPYQQSKRLHIYQKWGLLLLKENKAYRCFCTIEQLQKEKERQLKIGYKAPRYNRLCLKLNQEQINEKLQQKIPFCLRFNVYWNDQKDVVFEDLTYHTNITKRKDIEDFVIIKSDQYPTYNFAVVIDDHLMEITHIFRGSDHLTNTSKQILLYQSFNWSIPIFGHLSLIQFKKGQKMSKRHHDPLQNLSYYQENGYLGASIFNYLSFLGWTPDKFQEIFDQQALITRFDGKKLNKSQSVFNFSKVQWINRFYLKKMNQEDYLEHVQNYCQPLINKYNIDQELWQKMALIFKKEINCFLDLKNLWEKYFFCSLIFDRQRISIIKKHQKQLTILLNHFKKIEWQESLILEQIIITLTEEKLEKRTMMSIIYGSIINEFQGPKIEKLLYLIGKNKVIEHMNQTIVWCQNKKN